MAHVDLGGLWHEAAFRLVETYDVEVERGWRIALDRQPYGEVVRVLTGRCRFSLGGEHHDVGPGGIGILLPGPDRVTADLGEGPLRFRGFGFRVELFGAIELSGLLGLPLSVPHPWPALDDLVAETVRCGQVGGPAEAFRARATRSWPQPPWSSGSATCARSAAPYAGRWRRRWRSWTGSRPATSTYRRWPRPSTCPRSTSRACSRAWSACRR